MSLFLTHVSTSASNGVTYGDLKDYLESYFERDRYSNAVRIPKLYTHQNDRAYKLAFKLKSEIPYNALHMVTKVVGTKRMKKKTTEIQKQIKLANFINEQFVYFFNHEWIFDNASANVLQRFLADHNDHDKLSFDVSRIKWKHLVQNHAYGIKRYILKEEAYMPSQGYIDAKTMLFNIYKENILNPWHSKIF